MEGAALYSLARGGARTHVAQHHCKAALANQAGGLGQAVQLLQSLVARLIGEISEHFWGQAQDAKYVTLFVRRLRTPQH